MHSFGAAIVTYNGANRVRELLASIEVDRPWLDDLLIAEDPCPYEQVHLELVALAEKYQCRLVTGSNWGCMQGNATLAMLNMQTDVVALLSDDIIVTPGCLRDNRRFWETYYHYPVGASVIPSWGGWTDLEKMGLIKHPLEFHEKWKEWISQVPRNEFWDFDNFPRLYVNVHGSGFAVRRDVWWAVGGCSKETWCYDEDIAARIWLYSPCVVVVAPGRPFVHFGGMSQCGNEHPDIDFHTLDAWKRAWDGRDKSEIHALIREKMAERAYLDKYFRLHMMGG